MVAVFPHPFKRLWINLVVTAFSTRQSTPILHEAYEETLAEFQSPAYARASGALVFPLKTKLTGYLFIFLRVKSPAEVPIFRNV